jgi:hypothetical protein
VNLILAPTASEKRAAKVRQYIGKLPARSRESFAKALHESHSQIRKSGGGWRGGHRPFRSGTAIRKRNPAGAKSTVTSA